MRRNYICRAMVTLSSNVRPDLLGQALHDLQLPVEFEGGKERPRHKVDRDADPVSNRAQLFNNLS